MKRRTIFVAIGILSFSCILASCADEVKEKVDQVFRAGTDLSDGSAPVDNDSETPSNEELVPGEQTSSPSNNDESNDSETPSNKEILPGEQTSSPSNNDESNDENICESTPTSSRVTFESGDIGWTGTGTIGSNEEKVSYLLAAGAGQLMNVALSAGSEDTFINIFTPSCERISHGFSRTQVLLPESGDYVIEIKKIDFIQGPVDFELDFLVTNATTERVQFTAGDIGATVNGGILRGESSPIYLLGATAGQLMQVSISTLEENASFDIISPNGRELGKDLINTKALLQESGDHLIIINPLRGNVSYELNMLITTPNEYLELQLDPKTSSTAISGGILRGETGPVFGLYASACLDMNARISSLEDNASFDIYAPSGLPLSTDVKDFFELLPESGLYLITTNAIRGNVSFDLNVEISGGGC
ncbi:MAG: hypothetical protein CL431_07135 [Acidimicrobiaceae bacterium]|jgi:hypothetical protein|nr:hypothetical protein [Acidimicrobiaceae bacterium]|tara:strand:- start:10599 stop:11858 length:1260 start_codon:yes stop_codon:yes gene_type:complete